MMYQSFPLIFEKCSMRQTMKTPNGISISSLKLIRKRIRVWLLGLTKIFGKD